MNFKNEISSRRGLAESKKAGSGKRQVGLFGQKIAADFLRQRNYKIVAENFYTRQGELDIIAEKDGQLVFIEVKTRQSSQFGLPEEAVSAEKREKMRKAALKYLVKMQINHDNFRFDIIAIEIDRLNKKALIRHHKSINDETSE